MLSASAGHRCIMLVLAVPLCATPLLGDPAGMYCAAGGTLTPLDPHPTVALRNETIDYLIGHSGARVTVELCFENTAGTQDVVMGFPVVPGYGEVSDYRFAVDGKDVPARLAEEGEVDSEIGKKVGYGSTQWWLATVALPAEATVPVTISFNQRHAGNYGRPALRYWLSTGGMWKDTVDWVDVRVGFVDPENWQDVTVGLPVGEGCEVRREDDAAVWRLVDYDGRPGDFTITGSPGPALGSGLWGASPPSRGGRLAAWIDGRCLAEAHWLGTALRADVSVSDDGSEVTFRGSPLLKLGDFRNLGWLVLGVGQGQGGVPRLRYLFECLSEAMQGTLTDWEPDGSTRTSEALQTMLLDSVNELLLRERPWPEWPDNVELPDDLRECLEAEPTGVEGLALRRELLEVLCGECLRKSLYPAGGSEATATAVTMPPFPEAFEAPYAAPPEGGWVDVTAVCEALGVQAPDEHGNHFGPWRAKKVGNVVYPGP